MLNRREMLKTTGVGLCGMMLPVSKLKLDITPTRFKKLNQALDGGIHKNRKYLLEKENISPIFADFITKLVDEHPEQCQLFTKKSSKLVAYQADVWLRFDLIILENYAELRVKIIKNRFGQFGDLIILEHYNLKNMTFC